MLVPHLLTFLTVLTTSLALPFSCPARQASAKYAVQEPAPATAPVTAPAAPNLGPITKIAPGTYPRAIRISGTTLLLARTTFSDGNNIITISVSNDDGQTWSPQGTVTTQKGDVDNPYLVRLPSGRILCAFRNHDKDEQGKYTFFRITICYSDDDGKNWLYLSCPASDPGPIHGNWEPFLRVSGVNRDTLQLFYSRENSASDQDSLMRTSGDGGKNWSLATIISGEGITARDGMLGVTQIPGPNQGKLIAVFESADKAPGGNDRFVISAVRSDDDGRTWYGRSNVYTPKKATADAGAPQITMAGDGLMVVFMTNEDSDGDNYPANTVVKVVRSQDGGKWGEALQVFDKGSVWPGLLRLGDGSVLLLADNGGVVSRKYSLT